MVITLKTKGKGDKDHLTRLMIYAAVAAIIVLETTVQLVMFTFNNSKVFWEPFRNIEFDRKRLVVSP
jgi:hypothetical protein